MKVILDYHNCKNETGLFRYWRNISINLNKLAKNIEVILYTNLSKNNLPQEFQKFNIYTPKSANGFYRIAYGFSDAIKKLKPDLIHVQNFAPQKKTLPIVTTVHDLCFKIYPNTFSLKSKLAFKLFFQRSLDLSDAIICVSNYTKKMLLKFCIVDPEKVYVIYEAADPEFYFIENKKKVKEYLNNKFKIKTDYFLVVGTDKRKLPAIIIKVFKEVIKKVPNLNLVFTGPKKIQAKGEKNIRFLGYVSDEALNYLYNGAVSLIYLSLCEGFGLPLVEAMATKTPMICSNIPVFEEIAGNSAIFVKNEKELYQSILKIYQDKKLKKYYSVLSFKQSKNFSWEKTVIKTIKVYRKVLKTSS